MKDKPSGMQIDFAGRWLVHRNATKAAEEAGYSKKSAASQGSRMLKNPKVRSIIDKRLAEISESMKISTERVLKEYARLAFYDPGKLFDKDGAPIPINQLDEDTRRAIAGVRVTEHELIQPQEGQEDRKLVTRTHYIKTSDKRAALRDLGQHLELFNPEGDDPGRPIIFNVNIGGKKL